MKERQRTYIAIDLKSFYASVECRQRGRDPLTTNLVVADRERTEKTICLAVSPSLKAYGISGRARLFEVVQKVREVNAARIAARRGRALTGSSDDANELMADPSLEVDYICAVPQMAEYMKVSTQIYNIYLQYVAPEDIHVYSIDEVFIDATSYLKTYGLTARELAEKMIRDVLKTTGITATAGIAPNLFLCKVAMDIVAKHIPPDEDGVRIAELDEQTYRRKLWTHEPLTDFWRVGRGYAKKLQAHGMYTMGDVARCAIDNEEILYNLFGINAELLIDHAFGWEPCGISDVKAYKPQDNSLGAGQVLQSAYSCEKGKLVVREMTDRLVLDLAEKRLATNQISLMVGYDRECLDDPSIMKGFRGEIVTDWYGKSVPKPAHGTASLPHYTSSTKEIMKAMMDLYDRIVDPMLPVRRLNVTALHVKDEQTTVQQGSWEQMDLFSMGEQAEEEKKQQEEDREREKKAQQAILAIQRKFGKNAILKGTDLEEGATGQDRNRQIGGHRA